MNALLLRQAVLAEVEARVRHVQQDRDFLKQDLAKAHNELRSLQSELLQKETLINQQNRHIDALRNFVLKRPDDFPFVAELENSQRQLQDAQEQTAAARREVCDAWAANSALQLQLEQLKEALEASRRSQERFDEQLAEKFKEERKELEDALKRAFALVAQETSRAELYRQRAEFLRPSLRAAEQENSLEIALKRIENTEVAIAAISPRSASWSRRFGNNKVQFKCCVQNEKKLHY